MNMMLPLPRPMLRLVSRPHGNHRNLTYTVLVLQNVSEAVTAVVLADQRFAAEQFSAQGACWCCF